MEYRINVAKFQQSYGENRYIYLFTPQWIAFQVLRRPTMR